MKRILSLALVAAMLLSMMIFALVPASAADEVEGMWNTYGLASESDPDYSGEKKSVPGFEYTDDGFKMTTADWSTSSPFSQMSTTQKVDVKEGVYMEVRVDDFDYDASDKWFNFFLWSTPYIDEGATGFGEGVQELIRISTSTDPAVPGKLSNIAWYKEEFTSAGSSSFDDPKPDSFIVDGKNVLKFEVTYDGTDFAVNINGSKAPDKIIEYMKEHFGEDSMAYVGFAMLSSKAGGSQEATLLKFGTSKENAETPVSMGTDSKDAEDHVYTFADPETMEQPAAGQPAILMTGDIANSHLSNVPKSNIGGRVQITTDYTVKVGADIKTADAGKWLVDSDTSYLIEDFPVVMCITKNLCACQSDDGLCYAFESASAYIMTGDKYTADNSNKCDSLDICVDPYVIGDDSYLYFWYDTSWNGDQFKGRINGTHFSFGIDNETVGANEFEVVLQAFFKTEEDAEAFAEAYFADLGWGTPGGDPVESETDAPDNTEDTDAPDNTETETDPVEDTEPKVPVASESETTEKSEPEVSETETKAPAQTEKEEEAAGGCASAVGFGAIAIVAIATAAGFVAFKKKD